MLKMKLKNIYIVLNELPDSSHETKNMISSVVFRL